MSLTYAVFAETNDNKTQKQAGVYLMLDEVLDECAALKDQGLYSSIWYDTIETRYDQFIGRSTTYYC